MKTLLILLSFLILSTTAFAASPATDVLAFEYLDLTGSQAKFDDSLKSYAEQIAFMNPGARTADILDYLNESLDWKTLKVPAAGIVSATFTPDELKALNAFLKTPAGQSYARKSSNLSQELAKLVRTSIEKAIADHNNNSGPPI